MQLFPVGLDIVWHPQNCWVSPSANIQSWLVDTGSLTERIQSMCSDFEVQVVGQGVAPLYADEEQALAQLNESYHVREVVLFADKKPWVFARSIIPKALTQGEWQGLGNSPLGKRLFNDNRFTRGEFVMGTTNAEYFKSVIPILNPYQSLCARRSGFTFKNYRILVAEVFLPCAPIYPYSRDTSL